MSWGAPTTKGVANQAARKVKQGVGKPVGNDSLRAEGGAQEAKGKVQKTVGDVKSAANAPTPPAAPATNKTP